MASITGIVLAAGASSRMGQAKLDMRYAGATMLDATVAAVVAARVDRVIVVVGPDSPTPVPTSDRSSPSIVVNPDPQRGNMSSLLTATDADDRADAFILVPGDLPTISTSAIDGMIDTWDTIAPWAAVTQYRDRIAHPFLLSRALVVDLAGQGGSKVLWRFLVDSADPRVVRFPYEGDAPIDVNTPEDFAALVPVQPSVAPEPPPTEANS